MKKLAFLFIAVSAIVIASCGKGTNASDSVNDTVDSVSVDTVFVDSVAIDSVM